MYELVDCIGSNNIAMAKYTVGIMLLQPLATCLYVQQSLTGNACKAVEQKHNKLKTESVIDEKRLTAS